jgi:peptide/nickel transport system permease protein
VATTNRIETARPTTALPQVAPLRDAGKVASTEWRRRWRRFKQNRLSLVGAGIIIFLALVAIIGPFVAPYPADATGAVHVSDRLRPPSAAHWFGTDQVGRDIITRVLVGARLSLGAGFLVLVMATTIGTTLGLLSGFFGGKIDLLIQRVTDVFLTVPGLILAMAVAAALGPSLINVMLAISLVWWPGYCRLARGEALRVKYETYVEAARSTGVPSRRILLRHILPNMLTPVLVKASMDIGFAVLTLAALGFIGLGAQPPTPDWGKMIADGRRYLPESWWVTTFPGIAIFLTVFGFNILGDGIRDVFDPRARD